ncbi:hypothetical protein C8J57DRAFT_1308207 [Mycena rebaudengoi]|nr:hypothetical protein C8J57DRAFT_1308207 [Mycena rebaudengoi]
MRVPQELVDAMIDKVASLDDAHPALEACSLTARSFLPQSQRHLFAAVTCYRDSSDLIKFAALLAESPHIGELYVKYFTLQIHGTGVSQSHQKTIVVPRIPNLLPGLTHLVLDLDCDDEFWESEQELFKTSLYVTLSLHCLRSLCLTGLTFANVSGLESFLSHATGLKELILDEISFDNPSAYPFLCMPHESRVMLESLTVDAMYTGVDAMVSSFSTVDIKHLKSLVVASTPMFALLKANVQTLQKVRIVSSDESPFDFGILEGNQTLHRIEIVDVDRDLASSLQLFGPLGHLKALRTISFHLWKGSWDAVEWTKLNTILAGAGDRIENVYLSAYSESDLALVTQRLPAVAGQISHNDVFSRDYTFGP